MSRAVTSGTIDKFVVGLFLALSIPSRLRVLNLSHNQLTNDSLSSSCALAELGSLVKLDLSHNHLESVPLVLTKLNRSVYPCIEEDV